MNVFYHIYCQHLINIMNELLNDERISIKEKIVGINKLLEAPATLEILNNDVVTVEEKQAIMKKIADLINIAGRENHALNGRIALLQEKITPPPIDVPNLHFNPQKQRKFILLGLTFCQNAIMRFTKMGLKSSIVAICDETNTYVGKSMNFNDGTAISVIGFGNLVNLYRQSNDIAILLTCNRMQWNPFLDALKSASVTNVYVVPNHVYWDQSIDFMSVLRKAPMDLPMLSYYEYQPTRHCNLNCYHCGNYSNFASGKPVMLDKEQYKKDVKRLGELFWNVGSMRFQGGDPLVAAEILPELMQVTRETFPYADMALLSNGLLIPKTSEKVFEAMREYHVYFWLSGYPPTHKMYDKIKNKCDKEKIPVSIMPIITNWHATNLKSFELPPSNNRQALENLWRSCVEKESHPLEDGYLYRCCGLTPNTPAVYEHFGLDVEKNLMWKNIDKFRINIYDPDIDGFKINESLKMDNMIELCAYCANVKSNFKSIPWKASSNKKIKLEEYYWEAKPF